MIRISSTIHVRKAIPDCLIMFATIVTILIAAPGIRLVLFESFTDLLGIKIFNTGSVKAEHDSEEGFTSWSLIFAVGEFFCPRLRGFAFAHN